MSKWKDIGMRLLYPGKILTGIIPLTSFGLLIAVFYYEIPDSQLVYGSYVFAFYGLVVLILGCIPLIQKGIRFYKAQKAAKPIHIRTSLLRSLSINICYGGFHLLSGAVYQSVWLISNGVYYLILSLIRMVLVQYERKQSQTEDPKQKRLNGWRGFQICGMLMLLLNIAMSVMVIQMVWHGQGSHYPELVVYAVAAYTFYRLTTAIIRVVQSKGKRDPIEGAARNISLTAAMMSLYSLQTAMLSAFGNDPSFQLLMNRLSGSAVCLLVVLGALGMTLHGGKRKKEALK